MRKIIGIILGAVIGAILGVVAAFLVTYSLAYLSQILDPDDPSAFAVATPLILLTVPMFFCGGAGMGAVLGARLANRTNH
ncbi:MAG: hypothetical protein Tsb009_27200 [Planctomycetaceae bacterium]